MDDKSCARSLFTVKFYFHTFTCIHVLVFVWCESFNLWSMIFHINRHTFGCRVSCLVDCNHFNRILAIFNHDAFGVSSVLCYIASAPVHMIVLYVLAPYRSLVADSLLFGASALYGMFPRQFLTFTFLVVVFCPFPGANE